MEDLFLNFARVAIGVAEGAAVVIVAYGSVEAIGMLARIMVTPGATRGERKEVWRRFGTWLLLGLEFALAADIMGSVISPTWEEIGRLAAIAAIRTFLNYFLEKDLEQTAARNEERPATAPQRTSREAA